MSYRTAHSYALTYSKCASDSFKSSFTRSMSEHSSQIGFPIVFFPGKTASVRPHPLQGIVCLKLGATTQTHATHVLQSLTLMASEVMPMIILSKRYIYYVYIFCYALLRSVLLR